MLGEILGDVKMTMKKIFEKYQHLDKLLSDPAWLPDNFVGQIVYDLWQVVKDYNNKNNQ